MDSSPLRRPLTSAAAEERDPSAAGLAPEALRKAREIIGAGGVLALTGAGISTDSGIPDYRGPEGSLRKRNPTKHREFTEQPAARRRYWARSTIGWPKVRDAVPNRGHYALAELERRALVRGVITQNVDGLHQAAGSEKVLELHGSLHDVRCLSCGAYESREALQQRLLRLNPSWPELYGELAPDGDVELPEGAEESFTVPACSRCGGVLKPEVVFFGGSVPQRREEEAWRMWSGADSLLVAGSSLTVYSGYRFVRAAQREQKPVVIINDGATRGDGPAAVKLSGRIDLLLPALLEEEEH